VTAALVKVADQLESLADQIVVDPVVVEPQQDTVAAAGLVELDSTNVVLPRPLAPTRFFV
jgi:hypothetical protein